jgi:hypothetical protein
VVLVTGDDIETVKKKEASLGYEDLTDAILSKPVSS